MKLTCKMKCDIVDYMNTTGADRKTAKAVIIKKAEEEVYFNTPVKCEENINGEWMESIIMCPVHDEISKNDGYAYFSVFDRSFRHAI